MIVSKPDFQKAYRNANEILVSSKIITSFPYSATKLIKEQSQIVCRSFDKAHKYNVDIENTVSLINELSNGTHGHANRYSINQLKSFKKRFEDSINFVCDYMI